MAEPIPEVLIAVPFRNARWNLDNFVAGLSAIDFDRTRLSLAVVEGDSEDGSHEALKSIMPALEAKFAKVTLLKFDQGAAPYSQDGRRDAKVQRERRARIAKARNRIITGCLGSASWVLWIDADMIWWPVDILRSLLAVGADVVTPHCTMPDNTRSLDLNSFAFLPGLRDRPKDLRDGIYQPPAGGCRRYLQDFSHRDQVELDSVGGTMLLVNAEAHRNGLVFPPCPFEGYIETEGLARMAKAMGLRCIGLPKVRVVHGPGRFEPAFPQ